MSSDQKIKTAANKAPLGLIPAQAQVGPSRVYQYGARKYAAGNYYNATLEDGAGQRYVSAALRHLAEMQLPNGLHTPESLAALDPESGLPHLDHAICGLQMLRSIMVKCGALPVDPGIGNEPPKAEPKHEIGECDCRDCETLRVTTTLPLEPHVVAAARVARLAAEVEAEMSPREPEWYEELQIKVYREDVAAPRPRFEAVRRDQVNGRPAMYYEGEDVEQLQAHANRFFNSGALAARAEDATEWPAYRYTLAIVDNEGSR